METPQSTHSSPNIVQTKPTIPSPTSDPISSNPINNIASRLKNAAAISAILLSPNVALADPPATQVETGAPAKTSEPGVNNLTNNNANSDNHHGDSIQHPHLSHEHQKPWRLGFLGTLGKGLLGGDLYLGRGIGNLNRLHPEFGLEFGYETEKLPLLGNSNKFTYNRIGPHANLVGGFTVPINETIEATFSGVVGFNQYGYPKKDGGTKWQYITTGQLQADLAYVHNESLSIFVAGVVARPLTPRIEAMDMNKDFSEQDRKYHTSVSLQAGALWSF